MHYRPLRGLALSLDYQPGVPLRSTPGFMLSPAAAGLGIGYFTGGALDVMVIAPRLYQPLNP